MAMIMVLKTILVFIGFGGRHSGVDRLRKQSRIPLAVDGAG